MKLFNHYIFTEDEYIQQQRQELKLKMLLDDFSSFTRAIPIWGINNTMLQVCPYCSAVWDSLEEEQHGEQCIIIQSRKLLKEVKYK